MVFDDERISGELKIFKEKSTCSLGVEVGSKRIGTDELNMENQMGTRS